MAVNVNTGFADGDLLRDIRQDLLNPLAVKVATMKTEAQALETRVEHTYKDAVPDIPNKRITLTRDDGDKTHVNLDGMFKESSAITVKDEKGNLVREPDIITFASAVVTPDGATGASIDYDWDALIPTHQEKLSVGKTGVTATHKPKALYFKGNSVEIEHDGDFTTVTIPDQVPLLNAQIATGTEQTIDKLVIDGNVDGTSFNGNTLTLHIPDAGSGGISNQNFKGFFNSLGDIISEVTDPINGRSYAFAVDSEYGGKYYTPYFYVNDKWTELKQDPALLYSNTTSSDTQGVFSIKPDPKITVDPNGQLDLSRLGEDSPGHFHGFFETAEALVAAVPTPVVERSFAYVKHTNGAWIGKKYQRLSDGSYAWGIMAPLGGISLVSGGSGVLPAPLYGFHKNSMIDIDVNGVATIRGNPDPKLQIEILDYNNQEQDFDAGTLRFLNGKGTVEVIDNKLVINHPQRLIDYNNTFELAHNNNNYMGNIFYDKTSQCWMGWGVPIEAGGVGNKWTRIAHPKMSDEVKDLLYRYPEKNPNITPGVLGDNRHWQHTGWSFVEKDDEQLPESFRTVCGAYFITMVQDIQGDPQIPTQRIQICYADREGGEAFIRRFNASPSPGAAGQGWSEWVKPYINPTDLANHDKDRRAHHELMKYYKVFTFETAYTRLKNFQYRLPWSDMMLMAESTGHTYDEWNALTVPYNGNFKFSGRLSFDRFDTTGTNYPTGTWTLKVIKVDHDTGQEVILNTFSKDHTQNNKTYASLRWKTDAHALKTTDKINFDIQFSNDTNFATLFDVGKFFAMRSYIVIEDEDTSSGRLIAETFRKTLGNLNAREDSGVTIHPTHTGSTSIRVYGEKIDNTYDEMKKT